MRIFAFHVASWLLVLDFLNFKSRSVTLYAYFCISRGQLAIGFGFFYFKSRSVTLYAYFCISRKGGFFDRGIDTDAGLVGCFWGRGPGFRAGGAGS